MNIHEELTSKLILEKPAKVPNFKSLNEKKKKFKRSGTKIRSYAKNVDLYEPLDSDVSSTVPPGRMMAESEIRSKIIEINGCSTFHDKGFEEKWKKNVDENSKYSQFSNESKPNFFKNNALMKSLLNQKMNKLKVADDNSSDFTSGKNKENIDVNNEDVEGPCMIQSNEDPDFFFLRDTTKRDKVIDDGFRFSFRGTKKTTTPRSYFIFEVTEKDFAFIKKLMVKILSSDHLVNKNFLLNVSVFYTLKSLKL